jgi:predicted flavoprotein YhiN
MESKLHENYFAGEIVNIDAITGGFNFKMHGQNWLCSSKFYLKP